MVYHIIDNFSAIKSNEALDTCYKVITPWKDYAKWKKPDTRGYIFYDATHMQYPEKTIHRDRKLISCCLVLREREKGEWLLVDMELL